MRIAFNQTGFTTTLDPDVIDYRCFFPFGSSIANFAPVGTAYFLLDFQSAFALFRRVKRVFLDWDVADSGAHAVGSNSSAVTDPAPTDERSLICADNCSFSGGESPGTPGIDISCSMAEYQAGSPGSPGKLVFNVNISGHDGGPAISTTDLGGGLAFNADFFGQSVPVYQAAGVGASGFITVSILDYWEYLDSSGSNPVWDGSTGATIISPPPPDLG